MWSWQNAYWKAVNDWTRKHWAIARWLLINKPLSSVIWRCYKRWNDLDVKWYHRQKVILTTQMNQSMLIQTITELRKKVTAKTLSTCWWNNNNKMGKQHTTLHNHISIISFSTFIKNSICTHQKPLELWKKKKQGKNNSPNHGQIWIYLNINLYKYTK